VCLSTANGAATLRLRPRPPVSLGFSPSSSWPDPLTSHFVPSHPCSHMLQAAIHMPLIPTPNIFLDAYSDPISPFKQKHPKVFPLQPHSMLGLYPPSLPPSGPAPGSGDAGGAEPPHDPERGARPAARRPGRRGAGTGRTSTDYGQRFFSLQVHCRLIVWWAVALMD